MTDDWDEWEERTRPLSAGRLTKPVRRLNAKALLQARPLTLPDRSVVEDPEPMVEEAEIEEASPPPPASKPKSYHKVTERVALVYQREEAVMLLVDKVYKHFDDHNHADMFLSQRLGQLGGLSPMNYVRCEQTVAKVMSCLQA